MVSNLLEYFKESGAWVEVEFEIDDKERGLLEEGVVGRTLVDLAKTAKQGVQRWGYNHTVMFADKVIQCLYQMPYGEGANGQPAPKPCPGAGSKSRYSSFTSVDGSMPEEITFQTTL